MCDRCGALLRAAPTQSHYRSAACFSAYCAKGVADGSLVIDTGRGVGGGGGAADDASAAAVAAAVKLIRGTDRLLRDV